MMSLRRIPTLLVGSPLVRDARCGYHCYYCASSLNRDVVGAHHDNRHRFSTSDGAVPCRFDLCHSCMTSTREIREVPSVITVIPTDHLPVVDITQMQTVIMYSENSIRTPTSMRPNTFIHRIRFFTSPESMASVNNTHRRHITRQSSPRHTTDPMMMCIVAIGRFKSVELELDRRTLVPRFDPTALRLEGYDSIRFKLRNFGGRDHHLVFYHVFQDDQVLRTTVVGGVLSHHSANNDDDTSPSWRRSIVESLIVAAE
jgi:hypothetical protein